MIKHNCGIFGAYNIENAIDLTYYGLFELQHRGEEGAGIIGNTPSGLFEKKCEGLLSELIRGKNVPYFPQAKSAIGHVRYSTTGASVEYNVQPFLAQHNGGFIAIAHNGNLVNYKNLKKNLVSSGNIFRSTTDTEIMLHLIAQSNKRDLTQSIIESLKKIEGAYSFLILTNKEIYAVRDPHGFRPLEIGQIDGATLFSSESCAIDFLGAKYLESVKPGELIQVNKNGINKIKYDNSDKECFCLFELIYFSRPDSIVNNYNVYDFRKRAGKILSKINPVEADCVIGIPDTGLVSAVAFSEVTKIPIEIGLIRSNYIGRTFIKPRLYERECDVSLKYNTAKSVLKNKRVIVIDDSIVRGTTSRRLIELIKSSGAKEIHLRICSPPLKYPCFYGIDIPTKDELIASTMDIENIRKYLDVDTLEYIPLELLIDEYGKDKFCTACFSGDYPIKIVASHKTEL